MFYCKVIIYRTGCLRSLIDLLTSRFPTLKPDNAILHELFFDVDNHPNRTFKMFSRNIHIALSSLNPGQYRAWRGGT